MPYCQPHSPLASVVGAEGAQHQQRGREHREQPSGVSPQKRQMTAVRRGETRRVDQVAAVRAVREHLLGHHGVREPVAAAQEGPVVADDAGVGAVGGECEDEREGTVTRTPGMATLTWQPTPGTSAGSAGAAEPVGATRVRAEAGAEPCRATRALAGPPVTSWAPVRAELPAPPAGPRRADPPARPRWPRPGARRPAGAAEVPPGPAAGGPGGERPARISPAAVTSSSHPGAAR